MRAPFISCVLVLTLAACSGRDPVDKKAESTAGVPQIKASAPSASGEPPVAAVPVKAELGPASSIPAALQGRWGLTPADCMPDRSDAKGLLVVTAGQLEFYESRAIPTADADSDADSISGTFAFTGEGQSWTKYEALKLNKRRLVRTETRPTVSFNYAKCS